MVWFEYHLESLHGDTVVHGPLSPKSPKSPKSPRVIDPRRFITEEESIDLFYFMKQVCHDGFYEGCLFNTREFSSFSVLELINSRRFNEELVNEDFYNEVWLPTYRRYIDILREYTNHQLNFMGKKIAIPRKLFQRFVYHSSDKFVTQY